MPAREGSRPTGQRTATCPARVPLVSQRRRRGRREPPRAVSRYPWAGGSGTGRCSPGGRPGRRCPAGGRPPRCRPGPRRPSEPRSGRCSGEPSLRVPCTNAMGRVLASGVSLRRTGKAVAVDGGDRGGRRRLAPGCPGGRSRRGGAPCPRPSSPFPPSARADRTGPVSVPVAARRTRTRWATSSASSGSGPASTWSAS